MQKLNSYIFKGRGVHFTVMNAKVGGGGLLRKFYTGSQAPLIQFHL